jgi:hypothetical protein
MPRFGMETSIDDESARVFAGQLYNSLGFGRPLSLASEQARLQVQFTFDAVSGDPTLHTAAGVDPREVVLVAPDLGWLRPSPLSGSAQGTKRP